MFRGSPLWEVEVRIPPTSIALADLERGVRAFAVKEPRDAMYKVATKLIDGSWGSHEEVADALGVLLLTWNQAFYRYAGSRTYSVSDFERP